MLWESTKQPMYLKENPSQDEYGTTEGLLANRLMISDNEESRHSLAEESVTKLE